MEQFVIKGGTSLRGEVEIGGAKNAALAILAASIMTDETVTIDNLPDVRDINVLIGAMEDIGAIVERVDRHTVKINGSRIQRLSVDYEYIKKIRASYYLLGPFWENTKRRRWLFREDARSEAAPSTCTSRDSRRWGPMWTSATA